MCPSQFFPGFPQFFPFFSRRFLRETLKMSNAEDLNRLTACSLVLLGHIFYVLGNHRVIPKSLEFWDSPSQKYPPKNPQENRDMGGNNWIFLKCFLVLAHPKLGFSSLWIILGFVFSWDFGNGGVWDLFWKYPGCNS